MSNSIDILPNYTGFPHAEENQVKIKTLLKNSDDFREGKDSCKENIEKLNQQMIEEGLKNQKFMKV